MNKIETIALVAPGGNIRDFLDLENKIKILEKNFIVKRFYNENAGLSYLSDTDKNRAKFFENAFLDKNVDMVVSVRGGYGAIRTIEYLDFDKIKNSSKIYLASSDATILLCALSKKTNIKCFHGLMIMNGFVENMENNIKIIKNNEFNINYKTIKRGLLKGKLWGGNLSSVVSILSGDMFIPDDDVVLFLEDLNEPIYKIDKMLFEIYRCKKLREKIKGIIFGDFYIEKKEIQPLLKEYSELFDNIACIETNDITHKIHNITVPFLKDVEILAQ